MTVKKPSSFRASVGPLFTGFLPTENVGYK